MKTFIKEVKERATAVKDVNSFWRKMQLVGAAMLGVGTIIVAFPIALPAGIITAATYLMTVGTTITGISQLTKK
jgi:hypothetical protein